MAMEKFNDWMQRIYDLDYTFIFKYISPNTLKIIFAIFAFILVILAIAVFVLAIKRNRQRNKLTKIEPEINSFNAFQNLKDDLSDFISVKIFRFK